MCKLGNWCFLNTSVNIHSNCILALVSSSLFILRYIVTSNVQNKYNKSRKRLPNNNIEIALVTHLIHIYIKC